MRPSARRRVLAACVAGAALALLGGRPVQAAPELDTAAPPLKGRLISGEAFDLATLRGKVVLVNYYSSYCKFCAYEIGTIETYYEKYRAKGLEVVMLSIDEPGDRERSRHALDTYGLPGAMVADLTENGFGAKYPTPTCFVVDRAGVVRRRLWGAKTPSTYAEEILPLLGP